MKVSFQIIIETVEGNILLSAEFFLTLTEQGNSRRDVKGKYKRITREANTDALRGGGFRRSSVEALRKQRAAKGGTESASK